jgi:diadenosine tetraphosphate (Ap4A) HIT family hydrolase
MKVNECPFCSPDVKHVAECALTRTILDLYPVSPGHSLVVPKRHITKLSDATPAEQHALLDAVLAARARLSSYQDGPSPDGFNIGINEGMAAGQTVAHLHVHVIPRFTGDVEDPRGGIRHCIPSKGRYA